MIRLLLTAGCDVNEVNETGRTALHVATRENNAPIVLQLVRSGNNCDVNCQDDEDDTPLMFAAKNGHPLIVQVG